jgi:hypothetical protein
MVGVGGESGVTGQGSDIPLRTHDAASRGTSRPGCSSLLAIHMAHATWAMGHASDLRSLDIPIRLSYTIAM